MVDQEILLARLAEQARLLARLRRLRPDGAGGNAAFWPSAGDATRLAAWLAQGVDLLLSTLRKAPADLTCFTLIPEVAPRTFWIRRQAHQTAIHRGDGQAAASRPVTSVDKAFAQDGLAEIVGGPRNQIESGDLAGAAADAMVDGTSDQLDRWAWNRPARLQTSGNPEVLAAWRAVQAT